MKGLQRHGHPRNDSDWPIVRLADVADARLGKMLDAQKNRGKPLPYVRNPNIRWFDVDLADLKEMPFEEDEEEKYAIKDGDVLICEGGEAGRAAIWQGPDIGIKFQKAIHRVRPKPMLNNRFLVHRLFYDYHAGKLNDYYTGATIKHLTGQDLARYEFPLPPLDEQRRIAAILDQADDLRRKRREALGRLAALNATLFEAMFGNPISNPRGWTRIAFGDIVEEIASGWSPVCLDRPASDGEWGVLKLSAVTPCEYNEDEQKALPPDTNPKPEIEVRPGDLLFTRKNTRDLGRVDELRAVEFSRFPG